MTYNNWLTINADKQTLNEIMKSCIESETLEDGTLDCNFHSDLSNTSASLCLPNKTNPKTKFGIFEKTSSHWTESSPFIILHFETDEKPLSEQELKDFQKDFPKVTSMHNYYFQHMHFCNAPTLDAEICGMAVVNKKNEVETFVNDISFENFYKDKQIVLDKPYYYYDVDTQPAYQQYIKWVERNLIDNKIDFLRKDHPFLKPKSSQPKIK